ncbi:ribonuclease H-like domain-containing protein [Planctomycetota bacterium]
MDQDKSKKLRNLKADLDAILKKSRKPRKAKGRPDKIRSSIVLPPKPIIYQRDLPRLPKRGVHEMPAPYIASLDECVEGAELEHPEWGKTYLVTTDVNDIEGGGEIVSIFAKGLLQKHPGLKARIDPMGIPLKEGAGLEPKDLIFLDIESTGLGSSPLFLIGAMVWDQGRFEVRQYLARNYAEEKAVIALFADLLQGRSLIVSFNGKSFDLPFIRTRGAANGMQLDTDIPHFDLLHESRRIWKNSLPDCKLQTLEKSICGRIRHGDIPGDQIPDAYHAYVRTNNAWQIVEILKHNMLDLVTLADIMTHFPRE